MRNHITPQHYLKGFIHNNDGTLWVYDKHKEKKKYSSTTTNIGVEKNFYSDSTELYLSQDIEQPAIVVFDKIALREPITPNDKEIFSEYIAVMIKRGHWSKNRIQDTGQEYFESIKETLEEHLQRWPQVHPEKADIAIKGLNQLKEIEYSSCHEQALFESGIKKGSTPNMVDRLKIMTWVFLTHDERFAFLTSDNPVFSLVPFGIGFDRHDSEVLFPINKNVTLWMTWIQKQNEGYRDISYRGVRAINSNTVYNAIKWVYAGTDEYWTEPFVQKTSHKAYRLLPD